MSAPPIEYADDDTPEGLDESLAELANEDKLSSTPPPPAHVPPQQEQPYGGDGGGGGGGDEEEGGWGASDLASDISEDEYVGFAEDDLDDGASRGFDKFAAAQDHERRERERVTQLLADLDEVEARGFQPPKRFNHTSDPDEMENVLHVAQQSLRRKSGAAISKKLLTGFVGVIEMMNHQFDPMGLKLDGFSDSVVGNIDEYEDVLIRMYDKYASTFGDQHPLVELVIMLGLAGAQVHMMNSWADQQKEKLEKSTQQQQQKQQQQQQAQQQQQQQARAFGMAPRAQPAAKPAVYQEAPAPAGPMMPGVSMQELGKIISQTHADSQQEEIVPFPDRRVTPARPRPKSPDAASALDAALGQAMDQADAIVIDVPGQGKKKKN